MATQPLDCPQITAKPVKSAREICEELFNDFRECSHMGYVELMVLAYLEGQKSYSVGYKHGYDNALDFAIAAADRLKWKRIEHESIYDRKPNPLPCYASEVDDPVTADRRAVRGL